MSEKPSLRILSLFVAGLLFIVSNAYSQKITIKGQVISPEGEPISGAHVILARSDGDDITNKEGQFVLQVPAPKTYQLKITHLAYHAFTTKIEVAYGSPNSFKFTLSPQIYTTSPLVVTATRMLRRAEDVPLPVTVISNDEIKRTGSTRLSDILQEQTGLVLIADHGTGVQMQGLSAAYTKIMINGQPLIGRTAGTLNLDRISIGNVKRIEIIKGPSSALWGSDALAGVINIITKMGSKPFDIELSTRYAENNTWDLGVNVSANIDGWKNTFYFNRKSSQGYSLFPNAVGQTVPSYQNYTLSYRTKVAVFKNVDFKFNARFYRSEQSRRSYLGSQKDPTFLNIEAMKETYSLAPSFEINFSDNFRIELSHYFSRFRTDTKRLYEVGDSLYNHTSFDQYYNKTEIELYRTWNDEHITTIGAGYIHEKLEAERYTGIPDFSSYFIFAQHQWMPSEQWDIIAGFRYDAHSEYSAQFSPKLSVLYKPTDWLHIHASAGSGFKAPAFRQLYLNFTNPTVGYSVFGAKNAVQRIKKLKQLGIVKRILIPLDQLDKIQAEHSWAFNAGVNLYPANNVEIQLNAFYNDVNNLIETAAVATKRNGQSIYSYFNLNEVYTTGLEVQLQWYPITEVKISAGYQFLTAKRKVTDTQTVIQNGQVVEQTISYYKPLMNRSQHTANFKIYYTLQKYGLKANLRGFWRSKYGRLENTQGNIIYADGYMLWDMAIAKTFNDRYTLRLGIDNIFNFTRPSAMPYLPGRVFYAQISLDF